MTVRDAGAHGVVASHFEHIGPIECCDTRIGIMFRKSDPEHAMTGCNVEYPPGFSQQFGNRFGCGNHQWSHRLRERHPDGVISRYGSLIGKLDVTVTYGRGEIMERADKIIV